MKGWMMYWRVDGADKSTGNECTVIIEADNGPEMEVKAAEMDILVAKGRKATPQDLDEFLPKLDRFDSRDGDAIQRLAPSKPSKPDYREMMNAARWVRGFGTFFLIVGWLDLFLAIISLLIFLSGESGGAGAVAPFFQSAIICLVGGSVLRILGFIGLAVADIARNSFG